VDEFKFQSIVAEDFLEFYLEYFPELKKKKVDSIPGKQRHGPTGFQNIDSKSFGG
jgi:predicted 3-demethylubiquinone-9 3-methyltransferase (glyoxalase superfamily)